MILNLVPIERPRNKLYPCKISKDMASVNVFAEKQADKQTDQKLYAPDLSMRGQRKVYNLS